MAANPNDAFGRYGLALECVNSGDHDSAIAHFRQLLAANPEYVAGYQQYGQLLARLARLQEAREILTHGVSAAQKAGNSKAREEMEALLRECGGPL